MLAVERRIRFLNPVNFADQSPKAFRGDPFPETIFSHLLSRYHFLSGI
jgi:hypothetical protein